MAYRELIKYFCKDLVNIIVAYDNRGVSESDIKESKSMVLNYIRVHGIITKYTDPQSGDDFLLKLDRKPTILEISQWLSKHYMLGIDLLCGIEKCDIIEDTYLGDYAGEFPVIKISHGLLILKSFCETVGISSDRHRNFDYQDCLKEQEIQYNKYYMAFCF